MIEKFILLITFMIIFLYINIKKGQSELVNSAKVKVLHLEMEEVYSSLAIFKKKKHIFY